MRTAERETRSLPAADAMLELVCEEVTFPCLGSQAAPAGVHRSLGYGRGTVRAGAAALSLRVCDTSTLPVRARVWTSSQNKVALTGVNNDF